MHRRTAPPGIRATLRALIAPRRLVPLSLVGGSLVAAQAAYSEEPLAALLALVMCLAFLAVAPVSFRLLFEEPAAMPRAIVLTAIYGTIGVGIVLALGMVVPALLRLGPTLLTQPHNLVVCVALFLVGGWGLGRDISFEDRLHHETARAEDLARREEEAQLLVLRSHLDPHFLFNTLNAIAEWCVVDGATAERAVLQLSQMLRTMLCGVRTRTWSLADELLLIGRLCELHQLRDPSLVLASRSSDADLRDACVPPMLLLPLVENAIKHGPAAGHRGALSIEVTRCGDRVHVTITNPGPYRGPREGSLGLPTFERRLRVAYADRASFLIGGVDSSTRARLVLPLAPDIERCA